LIAADRPGADESLMGLLTSTSVLGQ
jgi:hypothetical protein